MTNIAPDTDGLKAAAKNKRTETMKKVLDAFDAMQEAGLSINFNSVANFTGVTKSWLYKQPDIKEQIQSLKGISNNTFLRNQATQLQSKIKQVDILTKQNKNLRLQVSELRQQLEVAYAAVYRQE